MYRFNGSSWVPMYPRTTIDQVQNLSSELANLQNQINNLSQSSGGWTLLYSGAAQISYSSFSSISLSGSTISIGDVLAIEVRYGSTGTGYNSRIILTAIGSSTNTNPYSTEPRKIGFTEFDGEYFKNIYFSVYRSSGTQLRAGYYRYLLGRFLPSSNTIEWNTNYSPYIYITRVWKVV